MHALVCSAALLGQLSVAHNDSLIDALHANNPFYARADISGDSVAVGTDATRDTNLRGAHCASSHERSDLRLAWMTKLGASVYATPMLVSNPNGGTSVWTNTIVRYAEALDAHGHELPGWPYAFTQSGFHTSPLAYDVDRDGIDDMLLVSFDAEIVFLSQHGVPLRGRGFKLPKLRVRKDWFEGLRDVHTTPFKRESHRLATHDDDLDQHAGRNTASTGKSAASPSTAPSTSDPSFGDDIGAHGGLSAEAEASFGLFAADDEDEDLERFAEGDDGDIEMDEPRLAHWARTYEDEDVLKALDAAGYLYVDAHALTTPTLADVDGDGEEELVIAVSYFIEEEAATRLARHGILIDKNKYVAGGVLAVDPSTGTVKWTVQLDLTTENTKLRAYIYSPVTVADLDGDGTAEVVVGTSMGFVYVLSGVDGALRDGFPVQMNEIQAQVVAADVDGDGALELIAADSVGSVAVWRADGSPVWEVQTSGLCAQGVTLTSSLRHDGSVQLIVTTTAGVVHVLEGRTGADVAPFPMRTNDRILSAALVVQLEAGDNTTLAPHIVFTSFDGYLYVVNAHTGCYERVDFGEHSYTQVLADDITGNGHIDLLLSTMNGNVFCFETKTPYVPLRAWRSQQQGGNVWQQREGFLGVAIHGTGGRHDARTLAGASFHLEFGIYDARRAPKARWYRVVVRLGRSLVLLNTTYHRILADSSSAALPEPWTLYRETLACPAERMQAGLLTISMTNEHGQSFEDSIAVTFNENFEEVLKWAALLPFVGAVALIAIASMMQHGSQLPI